MWKLRTSYIDRAFLFFFCSRQYQHSNTNRYKAARKVADSDEDITTTEYNLALFYAHQGEYAKAIELHRTILKKHPLFIESMLSLGSIKEQAGRFEEAQYWYVVIVSS